MNDQFEEGYEKYRRDIEREQEYDEDAAPMSRGQAIGALVVFVFWALCQGADKPLWAWLDRMGG